MRTKRADENYSTHKFVLTLPVGGAHEKNARGAWYSVRSTGPRRIAGDRGPPGDVLAVRDIEVTFHTAGSVLPEKSIDVMMSIYADDAVLTDTAHDNKVYTGKAQLLGRRQRSVPARTSLDRLYARDAHARGGRWR